MNGATHEVPLSRGRYLNLKTEDIGLRDANSLWTFELQRIHTQVSTLGWAPEEILEFFDDVMQDDQPTIKYLMAWLGWSLTNGPPPRAHVMWSVLVNGKSVLNALFQLMLTGGTRTSILDLSGRILWCCLENVLMVVVQPLNYLYCMLALQHLRSCTGQNSARHVKALTGGDIISARNLYENQVDFVNKAKMMLMCNHLPATVR